MRERLILERPTSSAKPGVVYRQASSSRTSSVIVFYFNTNLHDSPPRAQSSPTQPLPQQSLSPTVCEARASHHQVVASILTSSLPRIQRATHANSSFAS